jgi:hypothetical protein
MANLAASKRPSRYPAAFMSQMDQGWVVPKAQGLNTTMR